MKTPHASLIGLSLIAAAIFFKDTAVKPAHAVGGSGHPIKGFSCHDGICFVLDSIGKVFAMIVESHGGVGKWEKVR